MGTRLAFNFTIFFFLVLRRTSAPWTAPRLYGTRHSLAGYKFRFFFLHAEKRLNTKRVTAVDILDIWSSVTVDCMICIIETKQNDFVMRLYPSRKMPLCVVWNPALRFRIFFLLIFSSTRGKIKYEVVSLFCLICFWRHGFTRFFQDAVASGVLGEQGGYDPSPHQAQVSVQEASKRTTLFRTKEKKTQDCVLCFSLNCTKGLRRELAAFLNLNTRYKCTAEKNDVRVGIIVLWEVFVRPAIPRAPSDL